MGVGPLSLELGWACSAAPLPAVVKSSNQPSKIHWTPYEGGSAWAGVWIHRKHPENNNDLKNRVRECVSAERRYKGEEIREGWGRVRERQNLEG